MPPGRFVQILTARCDDHANKLLRSGYVPISSTAAANGATIHVMGLPPPGPARISITNGLDCPIEVLTSRGAVTVALVTAGAYAWVSVVGHVKVSGPLSKDASNAIEEGFDVHYETNPAFVAEVVWALIDQGHARAVSE